MSDNTKAPQEDLETQAPEAVELPEPEVIMPTDSQIQTWKAAHGPLEMADIGGRFWIYRRITRGEHRDLLQKNSLSSDEETANRQLTDICVLWPDLKEVDWDKEGAGTLETLVQLIMKFSGFMPNAQPAKL